MIRGVTWASRMKIKRAKKVRLTARYRKLLSGISKANSRGLTTQQKLKFYKVAMDNHRETFLGSYDFNDHTTNNIMLERYRDNRETFNHKFSFVCAGKEWKNYIKEMHGSIYQDGTNSGYIFFRYENWLNYIIHPSHIDVELWGDTDFIEKMEKQISGKYEVVKANIEWIYSSDGSSATIPLTSEKMPIDEMYPFLNSSLADYYDAYMKSSASILLLLGPPGTGKTTFIRGLLQHTNSSAMVSYDSTLLEKDYIFATFIEGDRNLFIVEDADLFLKSRNEGNTMMHKFLNVGDGLVTTKNKKMIFSTNLPSVREIDPALIRPGRCFDILEFRNLNREEATKLSKKIDIKIDETKDNFSLAELFHSMQHTNESTKIRKVGFL